MNEPLENCGNMADHFMIFSQRHNYEFRVVGCDCLPYSSVNILNINFKIAFFMGELLKIYNVWISANIAFSY